MRNRIYERAGRIARRNPVEPSLACEIQVAIAIALAIGLIAIAILSVIGEIVVGMS